MRTAFSGILTAILMASPGIVPAQSERSDAGVRDAMVRQFEASAPPIGALVPDLSLVDVKGRIHNLRELAGEHYTVLVLGCLT